MTTYTSGIVISAGVAVKGTIADLPKVAKQYAATTAILAVPSASRELVKKVNDLANDAGIELKVLAECRRPEQSGACGDQRRTRSRHD
ncbi:MAG: hypothetical protein V9G13_10940 [Marmoricola sp.]